MKLSLTILSLVALGSTLPVQQAKTESNERRGWFSTSERIGGIESHEHGRRGWFTTVYDKSGRPIAKKFLKI
ncbi:hypothetical protein FPOAC2_07514 [Fusarium poae]|uniref:hypothetical protein n=1 Tax=Fusarium poae TaxID=36050 RepID=UPI001CEAC2CA|nr:hypothetical protein FPOAC1_007605 [Fusarium poae]KAG8668228.1 hypothetical protein FPOAC1_007605 [Fusarium poae]